MQAADKYIVFGNPIAQSKSPQIHSLFAEQTQQDIRYTKLLVEVGGFKHAAQTFIDSGGKGLNITAPFKEDAYLFADELTERARAAEAVNTLFVQNNGKVLGDNTDGAGLVWDISERLKWTLENKRVLILGAGGAVKGVLLPLLREQPTTILIANRTLEKAQELAERFKEHGSVCATSLSGLASEAAFDIIINATSASLKGAVPELPMCLFKKATAVYDMVYGDSPTPFLIDMQAKGVAEISDGFGMLIGQAAESFTLWRGICPDINASYQALKLRG